MEDERKGATSLVLELILMPMAAQGLILMQEEALEQTMMLGMVLEQKAEVSQGMVQGAATLEEMAQETLMVEKDLDTSMDPLVMVHLSDHCWVSPQVCLLMNLSLPWRTGDHLMILMNGILTGMTGQDEISELAQTWTMTIEFLPEILMTVALLKITGVHTETLNAGVLETLTVDEGLEILMKGNLLLTLMREVCWWNTIHGVHLEARPEAHPGVHPEVH